MKWPAITAITFTSQLTTDSGAEDALRPSTAGLAMACKLIESALARRRALNAPHSAALAQAGARFDNGKLVERPGDHATSTTA